MTARFLIATAFVALAACNPQPQHSPAATSPSPSVTPTGLPPLRITGHGTAKQPVRIVEQNGNRKLYELVAKSYVSKSAQTISQATFAQATVTFYDKDGSKLTARAPVAAMDERNKQVVLAGGVHARTSTGLTLTCDRLAYEHSPGSIEGDGNVRITGMQGGARQVLTGNHFTSDVNLTKMVMQ